MFLKYTNAMFLWLLLLGTVSPAPSDEFRSLVHEGELGLNDEAYIKQIIPSGYSPQKLQKLSKLRLEDFINTDNEYYDILNQHVEAGHVMKGLTFNIYDDNMREATIALFRILQQSEEDKINAIREWAVQNINSDVLDYALRIVSLFRDDVDQNQVPPFISKPNFFVNGETIAKALKLKISNGKFNHQEAQVQQFYRIDDKITINSNYSGWNSWNENCRDGLDYFREDIGINSYYYGLHLLYPFWMDKDELTGIDSKYAERYYFIHRQLMARYNLEKEHLKYTTSSNLSKCFDDFVPYLSYDNGLPFSSRSSVRPEWNEAYARIKSIDIAIKECITRGVIFMDDATKVALSEDNYMDLLTKLIRANFEGIHTAKLVRSLFGYGGNGYPADRYNPAPSVLHHPQTTLRDPLYWHMIQSLLGYYSEFSKTLDAFDFSRYETEDFDIIDFGLTKIVTYFEYYEFSLDQIFNRDNDVKSPQLTFSAKQKRLKHLPFSMTFTVKSQSNKQALVKLFLGPQCEASRCWNEFSRFYELDYFTHNFDEGFNTIKWTPSSSMNYSFDDYYNINHQSAEKNKYDMFKFPESMIIPRGLEQGLNLTLFILVTPAIDDADEPNMSFPLPLGFPFHREAFINTTLNYSNYEFFNITVYHKKSSNERDEYYSPHLE